MQLSDSRLVPYNIARLLERLDGKLESFNGKRHAVSTDVEKAIDLGPAWNRVALASDR